MRHAIKLHKQKQAVVRAMEILEEIYPARIGNKRATKEGAATHIAWLQAALETIDLLDEGKDAREGFD